MSHVRGFRFDGYTWQVVIAPDRPLDLPRAPQQTAQDLPTDVRAALEAWLKGEA